MFLPIPSVFTMLLMSILIEGIIFFFVIKLSLHHLCVLCLNILAIFQLCMWCSKYSSQQLWPSARDFDCLQWHLGVETLPWRRNELILSFLTTIKNLKRRIGMQSWWGGCKNVVMISIEEEIGATCFISYPSNTGDSWVNYNISSGQDSGDKSIESTCQRVASLSSQLTSNGICGTTFPFHSLLPFLVGTILM